MDELALGLYSVTPGNYPWLSSLIPDMEQKKIAHEPRRLVCGPAARYKFIIRRRRRKRQCPLLANLPCFHVSTPTYHSLHCTYGGTYGYVLGYQMTEVDCSTIFTLCPLIPCTIPILSSDKINQVTGIRRASNPKGGLYVFVPCLSPLKMLTAPLMPTNKPRGWVQPEGVPGLDMSREREERRNEKGLMYPTHLGTFCVGSA